MIYFIFTQSHNLIKIQYIWLKFKEFDDKIQKVGFMEIKIFELKEFLFSAFFGRFVLFGGKKEGKNKSA